MGFIIGIDTGSTFTDIFAASGDQAKWAKVWTTPHDLTVCLMESLEQISEAWGLSLKEMLSRTDLIRYGTTVGTNTLIQKSGPRLGVIVTHPFEGDLYSFQGTFPAKVAAIVPPEMVRGIKGQVDSSGEVSQPLEGEEVRRVVEELVDLGARALVVSLRGAALNPSLERGVKKCITGEYPPQYLGSVPHFLSTAISVSREDDRRTNTALLNAYLHRDMVRFLYKAEDDLRRWGYRKPLLITHCTGGVARVAKTIALHTYGSGPVGCLYGCAKIAEGLYQVRDFISIDVGGTSVDIGVVKDGEVPVARQPVIEGIPIGLPMVSLRSVGGGGGARARVLSGGVLKVGPDSAGSLPGPAAYDLGGMEPTLCDAQLVLGYLDPDYYYGGKKKLKRERAEWALRSRVCEKTGWSLEEAAWAIIACGEREVAAAMQEEIGKQRLSSQLILFVMGGNGGMHCCAYASFLGIPRVIAPRIGAVAGAFGACLLDVMHIYRQALRIPLRLELLTPEAGRTFNEVVASLMDKAKQDMRGEGFKAEEVRFILEAELQGAFGSTVAELPFHSLEANRVPELFNLYRSRLVSESQPEEIVITEICLKALCPIPHYRLPEFEYSGANPQRALKDTRKAWWQGSFMDTKVYERDRLECGNQIVGPAIIEAPDASYLVPPGWVWTVDKFLSGTLERKQ